LHEQRMTVHAAMNGEGTRKLMNAIPSRKQARRVLAFA
jgi:hypothetical protein